MTFTEAMAALEEDKQHGNRTHAVRYNQDDEVWVSVALSEAKRGIYLLSVCTHDLHPGNDCECDRLALKDALATDWQVRSIL